MSLSPEEEAKIIERSQRDCKHHPHAIVMGHYKQEPQCTFCGITKSKYESLQAMGFSAMWAAAARLNPP